MKLKYIGKGSFLVGVPARDLSASEAKRFGIERLLNSNLYEEIKRKPKVEEPADDIQQEA
jgi:hypothetical protein